jgi:transcriptional regulator with XRE-family HTH domain
VITIEDMLIEARAQRGLTLKQVSEGTGLSIGFLSDIEHGRGKPSIDTVRTLAAFYGMMLTLVPLATDAEIIRKRLFANAVTAYGAGDADTALARLLEVVGDVIGFRIEDHAAPANGDGVE